jgi:trans-2,3-dihydro-3-hydroxyanthranilate isomerase
LPAIEVIMSIKFFIVDVFATQKYTGNQLAVCLSGDLISSQEMQQIAREINYSETTFITSFEPIDGGYPVRIFTPTTELPFAGHPTLGTAYIIQKYLIETPVDRVNLNYQIGQIPVDIYYQNNEIETLWMHQNLPQFSEPLNPQELAPVIGLDPDQIDPNYPIVPVSTGLPFIIVPLVNLEAIERARLNLNLYFDYVQNLPAQAILLCCRETVNPDRQLHVRVFTECFGIPEDPATGSANGCLAAYLAEYEYFGDRSIDITVEQGIEMGRPSLLYLQASRDLDRWRVSVGGKVIPIATGEL